jgi:hypothetical protein
MAFNRYRIAQPSNSGGLYRRLNQSTINSPKKKNRTALASGPPVQGAMASQRYCFPTEGAVMPSRAALPVVNPSVGNCAACS